MKVEIKCEGSRRVKLESLTPLQGDLKDLSDDNYQKLKTQILELGFSAPFFCWTRHDGVKRDSDDMLDGHQRLKTLLRMQEEEIELPDTFPIVDVDAKSYVEAKKKVLAISSNYGTMTQKGLTDFMKDIDMGIEEVIESFTFDAINFDDLQDPEVEQLPPGNDDDFVVDMTPDPVTKKGDIWILGDHRLMCGDSTMVDDVEKLMNREKADMVFTDPPYGIDEQTDRSFAVQSRKAKGNKFEKIIGDENTDVAVDFCNLWLGMDIKMYVIWGANYFCHTLPETGQWLVWDKREDEKERDLNSDCELAWVQTGKKSVRIFRHKWKGMIKASEHGQARVHPTQKPIALAEWCINEYDPGSNIFDGFVGSGSTLIACENTNRKCFGMELDEKYCDVIIKRWQKLTEKKAFLESTGNTFDELR